MAAQELETILPALASPHWQNEEISMYEYLRGKLAASAPSRAVIDVGGIGFSVHIGLNTFTRLPKTGEEVFFYVAYIVREDAHQLFGFLTLSERDFFETLNGISGIGPKTALALLGRIEMADLRAAIVHGNTALLYKVPGIGKKTAERIVVELKDKIADDVLPSNFQGQAKGLAADAVSALTNLGYHPAEAQKAVSKVLSSHAIEPSLTQLIGLALRGVSRV